MGLEHNIADRLLQIKAIKLNAQNPFTWASGLRSPIYCDNRVILSYPEARKAITLALARKASHYENFNAIAGVATAGIAWGALLADRLELPFVYIRSKPKEHGLKNMIEGRLNPQSSVLVIEDLISTGGSSLDAVSVIQAENHKVSGVLAIFQYGFPSAIEKFTQKSLQFDTLTNFPVLLEQALLQKYIDSNEYEKLKNWNADPTEWSNLHSD